MGAQHTKSSSKSVFKTKAKYFRLRKLRKNNSDALFSTNSTLCLEKCDSLSNINDSKSPSCANLYQDVYLEVDEGPEDFIRQYKELKNKVINWNGTAGIECRNVKQMLEVFVQELDACTVWELKNTLVDKTLRLIATLEEKSQIESESQLAAQASYKDALDASADGDVKTIKMYETFISFTCRLEEIKVCMIEYYGDERSPEFRQILNDLQGVLDDVKGIKHLGNIRVIVTREQYEDYIEELRKRFLRMVAHNKRQKRTSISGGGTAKVMQTA